MLNLPFEQLFFLNLVPLIRVSSGNAMSIITIFNINIIIIIYLIFISIIYLLISVEPLSTVITQQRQLSSVLIRGRRVGFQLSCLDLCSWKRHKGLINESKALTQFLMHHEITFWVTLSCLTSSPVVCISCDSAPILSLRRKIYVTGVIDNFLNCCVWRKHCQFIRRQNNRTYL